MLKLVIIAGIALAAYFLIAMIVFLASFKKISREEGPAFAAVFAALWLAMLIGWILEKIHPNYPNRGNPQEVGVAFFAFVVLFLWFYLFKP